MNVRVCIVVVSASVGACALPEPMLDKATAPNPQVGYVYGALQHTPNKNENKLHIRLSLKQVGGNEKEYLIELSRTEPVVAAALEPGRYALQQVVYIDNDGLVHSRKELPPLLVKGAFDIKPGNAVYIGHYEGQTWSTSYLRGWSNTWKLEKVCHDFDAASEQFASTWPKLSGLKRVDATGGGPGC